MAISLAALYSGRTAPRAQRTRFQRALAVLKILVVWPVASLAAVLFVVAVLFVLAVLSPAFLVGLAAAKAVELVR